MVVHIAMDVACLVLIVIFVVRGWKKGLVLSLAGLVVTVVSLAGAVFCAKLASPFLESYLYGQVQPRVSEKIERIFDETVGQSISDQVGSALTGIGLSEKTAGRYAQEISQSGAATKQAITESTAAKLSSLLAYVIVFILAFVILYIAIKLLARVLDGICKLPVLNFVNSLGGMVLGVASVFVLLCAIDFVLGFFDTADKNLVNTVILNFIHGINPLNKLLTI